MNDDRVIAILGSPRRGGNSDTLAMEFLRGASSKGLKHKLIIPTDLGMSPCDGDNQCFADGCCAIRDGMNEIYDEVLCSKYLLVSTPVYFMGPPGSLKSFMDRFQAVWARAAVLKSFDPDSKARRDHHLGFAIVVCASAGSSTIYRPALSIVKAFYNVAGFSHRGEIIATGLDKPDDVTKRADLLKQAFEAGQGFAA